MGLDFGASIGMNNLLALKSGYTFLFNYIQFEKPSWMERKIIPFIKRWIESEAIITLTDLLLNEQAKIASVSLNDVSSEIFSILYIVQHPETITNIKNGNDLFLLLAQMALEFEKLKKPRTEMGYQNEPRS